MDEIKNSATAAPGAQDPATRARDQLGAFFFGLAILLACGAVAAARDEHKTYFSHAVWWWVGWALLMYTPALVFVLMPWAMRTVFSIPPRGAVADATRGFYGLLGFVAGLAVADGLVWMSLGELDNSIGWRVVCIVVASLAATAAAIRVFRGRQVWLLALLPLAVFLNALLIWWVAGFFGGR